MRQFFAVTTPGLEPLARDELIRLGAQSLSIVRGGVSFEGELSLGFRVNLLARTITRVLLRLGTFRAKAFPQLFQRSRKLPWGDYLSTGVSVDVTATSKGSRLFHTKRIRETVRDAISKCASIVTPGDEASPQQRVMIRMLDNEATISLDMSGERLHRRGYREEVGRAPIRETMAAALLAWAGWQPEQPLLDPMCGSGTFPIEAALMATQQAPGVGTPRAFPFLEWPVCSPSVWDDLCAQVASSVVADVSPLIRGSDRDPVVVEKARRNAARANCEGMITLEIAPASELVPPEGAPPGLIVCNPPYGERIGSTGALIEMYRTFGRTLGSPEFTGWRALVLTTRQPLYKAMMRGLRRPRQRVLQFEHGGLKVFASLIAL